MKNRNEKIAELKALRAGIVERKSKISDAGQRIEASEQANIQDKLAVDDVRKARQIALAENKDTSELDERLLYLQSADERSADLIIGLRGLISKLKAENETARAKIKTIETEMATADFVEAAKIWNGLMETVSAAAGKVWAAGVHLNLDEIRKAGPVIFPGQPEKQSPLYFIQKLPWISVVGENRSGFAFNCEQFQEKKYQPHCVVAPK